MWKVQYCVWISLDLFLALLIQCKDPRLSDVQQPGLHQKHIMNLSFLVNKGQLNKY